MVNDDLDFKLSELLVSRKQIPKDKLNEIFNLFRQGNSYKDIAKLSGVSESSVRKYLNEHPELNSQQKKINQSNTFLELFKEGFNYKDIAELCDISEATVRKKLKENPDFNSDLKVNDKSNSFLELSKEGFSYKDIAEFYGLSEGTVRKYLNDHPEFDIKSAPTAVQRKQQKLEKSNQFLELYKQGQTYQAIGDKFGLTRERVRQILNFNPAFHQYLEEYEIEKELAELEKQEKEKRKVYESSLNTLYPKQTDEFWDHEKNGDLKSNQVPAGSTLFEIWWKCPVDGHSWKKKPSDITSSWDRGKRGCPACAGKRKKPEKKPILLTAYPDYVYQIRNYSKNEALNLKPDLLTTASNQKVWFKCPHDGHEWEARIHSTVIQQWSKGNAGCKVCNGTINRKIGEWTRRDPLIVEFSEEIKKYWDFEKNNAIKLFPDKVSSGSSRKAWFKCSLDGYEWQSPISSAYSDPIPPLIPDENRHPFFPKPATDSGAKPPLKLRCIGNSGESKGLSHLY